MFHQPSARLHQSLLQARQRPVANPLRKYQSPPEVAQVIGDHAQPQPHLVGPEPVTTQPCHLHRLLAFLDPLLGSAPLVIESHHRSTRKRQVRHNEPHSREQLSRMMLHLCHHPPGRLPTLGLVEKPLYSTSGFSLGLPTGRGSSSVISRSKLLLEGMRMAYVTPRCSNAS